jgi:hypothetical protein
MGSPVNEAFEDIQPVNAQSAVSEVIPIDVPQLDEAEMKRRHWTQGS